jgi:fermentation-respiration switch protein FrsA (DUF1100 family)
LVAGVLLGGGRVRVFSFVFTSLSSQGALMKDADLRQIANSSLQPASWRRRVLRLLTLAGVCYVGVLLVLLSLENVLLYHPIRASDDWLAPIDGTVQDVTLRSADGTAIHAWWCPTENWDPAQGAMLFCHGNAGNLSHRREAVRDWQAQLEQAVLIFDYPGYGRSEGQPSEASCYAAADCAYDWLVGTMQLPPERLLVYGESLGGGVAVELASRRPHRALILEKTFTSVPDVAQKVFPWLPVRWLMRNRFDNLQKVGRCRQPIFFAHGTADSLVPFSQGQRLFDAANEPKRFFRLEGADHNSPLTFGCLKAIRAFVDEMDLQRPQVVQTSQSRN